MKSPVDIFVHVGQLLDELGIVYAVVGSVASSLYGDARATADVDILTDLQDGHVPRLCAALETDFYVDELAVRRAVRSRRLFNAIHFQSLFKVDFYVAPHDDYTREQLKRRRLERLLPDSPDAIYLASPEDILLVKLRWHRRGGEVSARQLTDAVGILKVRGRQLDFEYLLKWADILGVRDLLKKLDEQPR